MMQTLESGNYLRRYTPLKSALRMISESSLFLRPPTNWPDQNDQFGIDAYATRLGGKVVHIMCLASGREHAHHWRIYAPGPSGACLQFRRDAFLSQLAQKANTLQFFHRPVNYCTVNKIKNSPVSLESVPFLKRYQFRAEEEYRLIAVHDIHVAPQETAISIDVSCIEKLLLNGEASDQCLAEAKSILSGYNIKVERSRLNNSNMWKRAIERNLESQY